MTIPYLSRELVVDACCQILELGFQASVYLRVQCGLSCHQWDLTAATMSCFHLVRHTLTKQLNMLLTDEKATLHQQHPLCCMYHFHQAFNSLSAQKYLHYTCKRDGVLGDHCTNVDQYFVLFHLWDCPGLLLLAHSKKLDPFSSWSLPKY